MRGKKPHITFSRLFFPHLVKNSNRRSSTNSIISPPSSLFYSLFKNTPNKHYEYNDYIDDEYDDLYDSPSSHYYTTSTTIDQEQFQNVNKQLPNNGSRNKRRKRRKGKQGSTTKRKSSSVVKQFKNIISRQQPATRGMVRPWWSNSISKRRLEIEENNPSSDAASISTTTTTTKSMDADYYDDSADQEKNFISRSDSQRRSDVSGKEFSEKAAEIQVATTSEADRRDERNSNKMLFLPPIGEKRALFGPTRRLLDSDLGITSSFHKTNTKQSRRRGPSSSSSSFIASSSSNSGSSNFLSKRIGKAATLKGKSLKGEPEKRIKRKKNKNSSSSSNSNFQNAFLLKKRNTISSSHHGIKKKNKQQHLTDAPSSQIENDNDNANRIKNLIRGVFEDLEEMDTLALQDTSAIISTTTNTGANTGDDDDTTVLAEPLTLAFNLTPDSNGELQIDGPIEELDPDLGSLLLPACFR